MIRILTGKFNSMLLKSYVTATYYKSPRLIYVFLDQKVELWLKRKKSAKEIVLMLDRVKLITIRSSINWRNWALVDSSRANHLGDAKGNHLIYNRSRSSPRLTVISNTLNQLKTRLLHQETKTSSLNLSHTRLMLSIKSRVHHPMAKTPLTRSLRTKITTYTQSMYV